MTPLAAAPQTWEVTCATCGQKRWPYQTERPVGYVCARCRASATSPEKRAQARRAGQESARRRKSRPANPDQRTEGVQP